MKKHPIPASMVHYDTADNFCCTACEEPLSGYALDLHSGKKQALSFSFCSGCLGYTQKEFKQFYNNQEK